MRLYFAAFLFFLMSPTWAATVTLDFEELYLGSSGPTEVISQGFVFNSLTDPADGPVGFADWKNVPTNNSTKILRYCQHCSATMSAVSGDSFDLLSFDMNTLNPTPDLTASFTLSGYYAGGGQISVELTADTVWSNYTFDSEWSNLVSLEFGAVTSGGPFSSIGLDNLRLTTVPIPGAVWLFGSALAGLGWMRRKQAV